MLLTVLFFTFACDPYAQDDFEEFYVVESFLVADRNLPAVRLSVTLPVEEEYTFEKAAISEANVEVSLLQVDGKTIEKTYDYRRHADGIFVPVAPETVLPERTYQLRVTFPGNDEEVSAKTLVPGSFRTVGAVADSIAYQSPEQITVNTTRSFYPGRQAYFIFTVNALDPTEENLTPFYADIVDEQDNELSDFVINSSGIINEGNYDLNSDSTITLRVPWLAVAFYNDNNIIANAVDNNMYDFLRSQEVQTGGSTLPPGEIQNVIYNVEGGIGVFGSMVTDTNKVFVKRNDLNKPPISNSK